MFPRFASPIGSKGKKTLGLELAEQLGWTLPDVLVYPTGGGTGLIGMWKAFGELLAGGWINGPLAAVVRRAGDGMCSSGGGIRTRRNTMRAMA